MRRGHHRSRHSGFGFTNNKVKAGSVEYHLYPFKTEGSIEKFVHARAFLLPGESGGGSLFLHLKHTTPVRRRQTVPTFTLFIYRLGCLADSPTQGDFRVSNEIRFIDSPASLFNIL
jgi:hypothetical protein